MGDIVEIMLLKDAIRDGDITEKQVAMALGLRHPIIGEELMGMIICEFDSEGRIKLTMKGEDECSNFQSEDASLFRSIKGSIEDAAGSLICVGEDKIYCPQCFLRFKAGIYITKVQGNGNFAVRCRKAEK